MINDLYCLKSGIRYYGVIMCFGLPVIVSTKSLTKACLYEHDEAVIVSGKLSQKGIQADIIGEQKERRNFILFLRKKEKINNFKSIKYATCNHTH